ncbi:MAG TPA: CHAT domain-containing protein [Allosphingosinicella sp.]|nr:CHAT domain-containing protein [Allosphingosinicella sp.]
MLNSERLAELIESAAVPELAALLDALPATNLASVARTLALGDDLQSRLSGLNIIADELARGKAPLEGAHLAGAVLKVSLGHLDDPDLAPALIAESAAQAATSLANALSLDGEHEDIVALSTELERVLWGRSDGIRLGMLRLAAVDALIALGRLEEAEAWLTELEARAGFNPSLPMVRKKLTERLQDARDLADSRSPEKRVLDQYRDANIAAAEAMAALMKDQPEMAALAAQLVDQARKGEGAPTTSWEVFERATTQINRMAGLVGVEETELHRWHGRVRTSSKAFNDNGGTDPALLGPALETFRAAIAWYDANGQREDGYHARWCAYIAERRLGRPGAALDLLEELAARLEEDRAAIADPLRRASDPFPLLPAARVECAHMLGDPRRMLAAIEAAKGRALADLQTKRDARAFDEAALHAAPQEVEDLVARLGVGYASFLAIDVAVFAVAVWPDGGWHSTRIDLDEAARRDLARLQDPASRARRTQPAGFDWGAKLAPLTDWLLPLLPTLPEGGHLVFSPDGELHMWPLQMAATPAGPLGLQVGISRVHGIDTLRRVAASAPRRPKRSITAHILADDEELVAEKAAAMAQTLSALPDPESIPPEAADEERFTALGAGGALLYVNAHGIFPEERFAAFMDPNPYRSAGMVLAHDGRLPPRSASWPHRLSPAVVLESPGLDVQGATVVLQGCVSGLAKEGRGGDALGLEWAFLVRGADAVLASHWNVDYRTAGAFCRRFCEAWLVDGKRRIDAWQEAAAATLKDPEGGPEYDWAAFSLTGDWR